MKLDRSEKKLLWYPDIFIIFEALIQYLEHKGRLIFKNVRTLLLFFCSLSPPCSDSIHSLNYIDTKKSQNECWNRLRAWLKVKKPSRKKETKNVRILLLLFCFVLCLLTALIVFIPWIILTQKKSQNECWNRLRAWLKAKKPSRNKETNHLSRKRWSILKGCS